MKYYMVTNGTMFLKREKNEVYSLTEKCSATRWHTREQAMLALNSGIDEWARDVFFIEETNFIGNVDIQKLLDANTKSYQTWCVEIGGLKVLTSSLKTIKNELERELSDIDGEICDIVHYIEFNRLNAAQGWAAYEMIKTSRIQRRKIKNLLYIINEIQRKEGRVSFSDSAKKAIASLNNREYRPRKLYFLFEKK